MESSNQINTTVYHETLLNSFKSRIQKTEDGFRTSESVTESTQALFILHPMNKFIKLRVLPSIFLFLLSLIAVGQALTTGQEVRYNPITTAVPFLTITPDSRHGGMGDVGAATSPDANSQYLNPAKYAFIDGNYGFSVSYTPWLRELVSDNNLAYLAGFYRIDKNQVIGSSLRYFSMGDITLTGADRTVLGTVRPSEFAVDFSYSRKLSDKLSGGVALRFIHSDITGGNGAENYTPALPLQPMYRSIILISGEMRGQ